MPAPFARSGVGLSLVPRHPRRRLDYDAGDFRVRQCQTSNKSGTVMVILVVFGVRIQSGCII